jgi:hypothetical protein
MLAFSLDNLIFLLLIAVAALFQLLSKAISKAGKGDSRERSSSPKPQTPRPVERAPRESDADRIRKFLEALGQPPSSTPPPAVLPRTDIPPRPLAPVQPPPVVVPRAWRLPQERPQKPDVTQEESDPTERAKRFEKIVPPQVPVSAASVFEVHETSPVEQPPNVNVPIEISAPPIQAIPKREDFKMNIATLLASKSTLRAGILLREILGTPRGLQHLDLIGN